MDIIILVAGIFAWFGLIVYAVKHECDEDGPDVLVEHHCAECGRTYLLRESLSEQRPPICAECGV